MPSATIKGMHIVQLFMTSPINDEPMEVHHPAILITINDLYRDDMTPLELYEATRGIWRIGDRRGQARYAIALYRGIAREVYVIDRWYPAGTLKYVTRSDAGFKSTRPHRWEFSGEVAEDIREEYVGRRIKKSGSNPIQYVGGA